MILRCTRCEYRDEEITAFLPLYLCPNCRGRIECVIDPDQEVCDFCSDPNPKWAYDCESFVVQGPPITINGFVVPDMGSQGGWAACDECSMLIEQGGLEALARRSEAEFFRKNPEMTNMPDRIKRAIARDRAKLQAEFAARRQGPRIPAAEYIE